MMFEYLIIFGVVFLVFALFFFVLAAKKPPGHEAPHTGCCGGQKEKTHCRHCSEPIHMPDEKPQDICGQATGEGMKTVNDIYPIGGRRP